MVCLDSTFVIDVLKGKNAVEDLEEQLDESDIKIKIPSPVIIEIIRSLYLYSTAKNISKGEKEKTFEFLSSFEILNLDKKSAIKTGEIEATLINKGETIDLEDIMIAAICISNDETLTTRNKKHFEKILGLKIQDY
jgi:tRNA(fMet)-specific endonuclease VapC